MPNAVPEPTRRTFLKASLLTGAGLMVAVNTPACTGQSKPQGQAGAGPEHGLAPNAWVRISPDNQVTVMIHHSEMGQGITTGLAMIVAEEMDADWSKVRVEMAPVAPVYKNPAHGTQSTGGSTSLNTSWEPMRQAAASVRAMFITAAAGKWGVDPSECTARDGEVIHKPSKRGLRFGQLLERAAQIKPPEKALLKKPDDYRLVGKPLPRLDTKAKTAGKPIFGADVSLPGMLNAAVVHPPVLGEALKGFDDSQAKHMPGVKKIFPIESGVAVVADTYWQALRASEELKIQWSPGPLSELDTDSLMEHYDQLLAESGEEVRADGDAEEALARAHKRLKAVYRLPLQAHACPEPMNCTAHVRDDGCDVWAPTQTQGPAREIAAIHSGHSIDRVNIRTTYMGGGFGRRGMNDYVSEAVQISKEMKAPVKIMWTREQDIKNDFFRPAFSNLVEAGLDEGGNLVAWRHRAVGPAQLAKLMSSTGVGASLLPEWAPSSLRNPIGKLMGRIVGGSIGPENAMSGSVDMPYSIANMQIDYINHDPGMPVGAWRSVGDSRNAFVNESFLDEIAVAAGKDPVDLRLGLLGNSPRHKRVLELAAGKAGWGGDPPRGVYRGVSLHAFHGTPAAMVAEASVGSDGMVKVHRMVTAVDCGLVVNPKIVEAQMISGVIFGLTAALKSSISIKKGRVQQGNFDDFPLLRMDEAPKVEVHIVKSREHPIGLGEVPVPPTAPAVANAVFAATGKRVRSIPIDPEFLKS